MKKYISVCGAANLNDIKILNNYFKEFGINKTSSHAPAIGFLTSPKIVAGEHTRSQRFIPYSKLFSVIEMTTRMDIIPILHYCPTTYEDLGKQIIEAFQPLYPICSTIQINNTRKDSWHPIEEIEKVKNKFPNLDIIIQLGPKTLLDDNLTISKMAKKYPAQAYLIDPSMGTGGDIGTFDIERSIDLYHSLSNFSVIFAGGFSEDNIADIAKKLIFEIGNDFSIDSEGKLRFPRDHPTMQDQLDYQKTRMYIKESAKIILGLLN